jgi:hypothetical protein
VTDPLKCLTPERRFPVLWPYHREGIAELKRLECPRSVPWDFVAEHRNRCFRNHSQSVATLAKRGGLAPVELLCVIEERSWDPYEADAIVVPRLMQRLAAWETRRAQK